MERASLTPASRDSVGSSGASVDPRRARQTPVGTTDSTGKASANIKLVLKPGSYTLSADFPAGDAKYNASGDTGLTFVIGNK